jgi:hypothetical protein
MTRLLARLGAVRSRAVAGMRAWRHRARRFGTPIGFPQEAGRPVLELAIVPDPMSRPFRRLVGRARRAGSVRLAPALGADTAAGIEMLARAGAPLTSESMSAALRDALPPELVAVIERPPFDPADSLERERHSVELRRVALRSTAPEPLISVLLATRRPADLPDAVAMVRDQRGCRVQLCVGLHGDDWPDDIESTLEAGGAVEGVVVERFADEVDLGTMLDRLGRRADGAYVSKWDDDDHYGRDHLADLVAALAYSGAQIVGKAAEFVHLEAIDTTIRRYATGAEHYSTTLAGGTLLLETATLRRIGGWPAGPRRVDGLLIDEILAQGGSSYRTHGFQFVLRRRPPESTGGHTWHAPDAYFLDASVDQRPGLDLRFAGVDG